MLSAAIAVFFGGVFGALFRFLLSEFLPLSKWGIPFTIIIINFLGCFLMGILSGILELFTPNNKIKQFLLVGFLGGFTTFSSFSFEFSNLIKNNNFTGGFLYLIFSIVMPLSGFWLEYVFVRVVVK